MRKVALTTDKLVWVMRDEMTGSLTTVAVAHHPAINHDIDQTLFQSRRSNHCPTHTVSSAIPQPSTPHPILCLNNPTIFLAPLKPIRLPSILTPCQSIPH